MEEELSLLDGGGMAYFAIDVPGARPILDLAEFEGTSGRQAADILAMTDTAVGAVYAGPPPEAVPAAAAPANPAAAPSSARRYLLAARGKYPSGRAGFAFNVSGGWKQLKSPTGKRYWYSQREDLAVFLDARSALVSNTDPYPRSSVVAIPAGFRQFRQGAVLSGWLNSPAVPLNRFIAQLNIPIQIPANLLVFGVYPAERPMGPEGEGPFYAAVVRLETQSSSQAKALAAMFGMVRLFAANAGLPPAVAALLANPPTVDEAALLLKTASLEPEAIALLFNAFSVYSK